MNKIVLKGDIVFTPTKDKFETYENSYIVAEDGRVVGIYKKIK